MKNSINTVLFITMGISFPVLSVASPVWQLDVDQSQLSYVSTKNKTIAENNTVKFQSGQIKLRENSAQFDVDLILDLTTVDTQIPIRDERVKSHLFNVKDQPVAKITSIIPQHLPINESTTQSFTLSLNGQTKSYEIPVMIQKVNGNMIVTSYEPVLIHAKDHGLNDGIDALLSIAKLQAISYEVPVDFKLVFHKINQPSIKSKDQ